MTGVANYSYLSVMRIEEEARRHDVRIAWKPFLLGPLFRALGMENSPFMLQRRSEPGHANRGRSVSSPRAIRECPSSPTSLGVAANPPDCHDFCPCYRTIA
jgi:hypothetical protein